MDRIEGFWVCGHCGNGEMLLGLDTGCVACGRRRDASARTYDIDRYQIPESSDSQKKKALRTENPNTSMIVKRSMEGESEGSGSVILDDVDSHRTSPLSSNLQSQLRDIVRIPNPYLTYNFSHKEDLSFSNRCKAFLEEVSGERWCWWPLRPRMRLLQDDEIRVHWRCVSGVNAGII